MFTSTSPGERSQAKNELHNMLIALIIIPTSPHLYQILVEIAYELTISLLGGDVWHCNPAGLCGWTSITGTYQEVMGSNIPFGDVVSGVYNGVDDWRFIFIFCCTNILVTLALMLIFIRHMIVVLCGILMPLTVFLYTFGFTKSVGRKFLKYSITWAMVPVIMSVWIIAAGVLLINLGANGIDPDTGTFMTIAFLGMIIMSPMIITGALEFMGSTMAAAGQFTGGATGAGMTAAGQIMKAKSPEAMLTAGVMVASKAVAKGGGKGFRKAFEKVGKKKPGAAPKKKGVMGKVGDAGKMAAAGTAAGAFGAAKWGAKKAGGGAMMAGRGLKKLNDKTGATRKLASIGKKGVGVAVGAAKVAKNVSDKTGVTWAAGKAVQGTKATGRGLATAGKWTGGAAVGVGMAVGGAAMYAGGKAAQFGRWSGGKAAQFGRWSGGKAAALGRGIGGVAAAGGRWAAGTGIGRGIGAMGRGIGRGAAATGRFIAADVKQTGKDLAKLGRGLKKFSDKTGLTYAGKEALKGLPAGATLASGYLGQSSALFSEGGAGGQGAGGAASMVQTAKAGKSGLASDWVTKGVARTGGKKLGAKLGASFGKTRAGKGLAKWKEKGGLIGVMNKKYNNPIQRAKQNIGETVKSFKEGFGKNRRTDKNVTGTAAGKAGERSKLSSTWTAGVKASEAYLNKNPLGRGINAAMDKISGMGLGQALGKYAAFSAKFGAASMMLGMATTIGAPVLAPLAGLALSGWAAQKLLGTAGVGIGLGNFLRDTNVGRGISQGVASRGVKNSTQAFQGMKGMKGGRSGFAMGKGIGMTLDAAGFLMLTAPAMMAEKGIQFAMTGGMSGYSDMLRGGVSLAKAPVKGVKALREFNKTRKDMSTGSKVAKGNRNVSDITAAKYNRAGMSGADLANASSAQLEGKGGAEDMARWKYDATHKPGSFDQLTQGTPQDKKKAAMLVNAEKRDMAKNSPEALAASKYDTKNGTGAFAALKSGTPVQQKKAELLTKQAAREQQKAMPEKVAKAKYDARWGAGAYGRQTQAKKDKLIGKERDLQKKAPAPLDMDRRDHVRDAKQKYDAKKGKGAFDALGITAEGRKRQQGIIANQGKDFKTDAVTLGVETERAQGNQFFSPTRNANKMAFATGMSMDTAEIADQRGYNLEKLADGNAKDIVSDLKGGGASDVDMNNISGIQTNAQKSLQSMGMGIGILGAAGAAAEARREKAEEQKVQESEAKDAVGATGNAGAERSFQHNAEANDTSKSASPGEDKATSEARWRELKQAMVYGGRPDRSKGSGEQLEEMLEDRDESPMKR